MNLHVMLDLAHREIPDVQSVVVRQGESGALTLKIAIVENKKPVDLTGYEAYLKAARPDGAVISQPCTIEQPTKGGVSYTLPPEITGVVGKISLAHVEIRKSDTLIATTDDLSILVRPCVDMDAAEATSVVSEIEHLKELLHGIIDDGSAQLGSQSSEFTALKSESQAAAIAANSAAANANTAKDNANTAAQTANTAASNADESASGALSAAQAANTAASNANTAKDNADTAAANADAATSASATQTAACAAATTAAMDVATTALSKRRADTLYANAIIGNAQGDMVHVEDAWEADAVGLGVRGKSVQDGTPTPDTPVEVDVVDSPVSVQATGKNLNILPYESTNKVSNGITWTLNNDGSVTANGTATAFSDFYFHWTDSVPLHGARIIGSGCPAGGSTNSYCIMVFNGVDTSQRVYDTGEGIAIPDGWESVRFFARIYNGTTASNLTFKPQIEVGTSPTSYEPYTSNQQTITLPSDHNYLASLPDGTHDELVLRADGVAVLTERVGKRVFNGSEAWSLLPGVSYGFRLLDTTLLANYSQLICDRYTVREYASTSETQGTTASAVSASNRFCFRDTTIDQTVDAWKAKLTAYNVTVYYALAATTVRYSADNGATWSTTDPNAGNSAIQLYKGTNNVWCTDALSPNVSLEYVQDTTKVINELRAAIVASGATS